MDLARARAWLDSHINHETASGGAIAAGAVDGLSLEPMRRFCSALGDPQSTYPVIHVTGTNGKGSVVATVESLISHSGLSVGSTTSPHLGAVNERIRRNGTPISDEQLADLLSELADIEVVAGERLSWFELVCAGAFSWFSTEGVDVAVVEVGLLGRFDATNVVDASVAVITGIGRDHTDGAPGWESQVLWEKAGIIGPDADAVVGRIDDSLLDIVRAERPARLLRLGHEIEISDVRRALGGHVASITTPWGDHDDVLVPVHGRAQVENAALSIAAVESFFDRAIDHDLVTAAVGSTLIPGRCEVVAHRPLVVLDGGHNAQAAEHLVDVLSDELAVVGTRMVVVGMLSGRDPADVLRPLVDFGADLVICTTAPTARGMPADAVARAARALGLPTERVSDPVAAVRGALQAATTDDVVVVCGSFTLIEPARFEIDRFLADRPTSDDLDDD